MNTSQKTTILSKPEGNDKILSGTLNYFRARNKSRVFNIVRKEFDKSGLTQTCLGQRLAMDKGQLSRYLNAPGNWTLDMFSDFLFAISGAVPLYRTYQPLDQPARNYMGPDWLSQAHLTTQTNTSVNISSINYGKGAIKRPSSGGAKAYVKLVVNE